MKGNLPTLHCDSDVLGTYFERRRRERARRIEAMLAALRPRERALVREAAVLGFVEGHRAGGGRYVEGTFPSDDTIVGAVLGHGPSMPDLYPWLARLGRLADKALG